MDDTYEQEPYKFILGATPTTKGFESAISSMNLHEKAQFKISHKWMYGKAGIPTNIPPGTDFTFQIHRIEAKKQKENKKAPNQTEVGLHIHHNQEPRREVVTQKISDQAILDIIQATVKKPTEQLESPPGQQDLCQQATQLHSDSFLAQGQHTKHKT